MTLGIRQGEANTLAIHQGPQAGKPLLLQMMFSSHKRNQAIRTCLPNEKHRSAEDPHAALPSGIIFATANALPRFPQKLHSGGGRNRVLFVRLKLRIRGIPRSEEHTSELQSQSNLVCRLLLEKK